MEVTVESLGGLGWRNWVPKSKEIGPADGAGVLILFHVGLFCSTLVQVLQLQPQHSSRRDSTIQARANKPMLKTRVPAISRFE